MKYSLIILFIFSYLFYNCTKELKPRDVSPRVQGEKIGISVQNKKTGKLNGFISETETPYWKDGISDKNGGKIKYLEGTNAIKEKKWKKVFYTTIADEFMKKKGLTKFDNVFISLIDSITNGKYVIRLRLTEDIGILSKIEMSNLMDYPYKIDNDSLLFIYQRIDSNILDF